uniref:Uncharacterized protein n=1 Tax=Euplotes harpa TaxID=151035 RepID=A0A7S3J8W7_9SPIT|mmetsp:Transcript_26254/g.30352  ORF Transcript_26254/g.30352 Transcript_26254/m.30352 type:complete len:221 (+) Transcript_26254:227-889(+)
MKQALIDLGMTEAELKEPQLTKQSFIEKAKKKQKYEEDVDTAFRKKFGIKQHSSLEEYTDELKTKAKELEGSIDKIDAEERKLLNSRKFEYETHLNEDNEEVSLYEDPTKEDFKGHFLESYSRVKSRIKEMKEEGIITNEIEEEKAEQEARRAEKIAQEQEAKETEKEHRFIQRIEKRESRYTEEKQSKRRQNYYQRKENREYKSQGFGVDNNNMWDPDD